MRRGSNLEFGHGCAEAASFKAFLNCYIREVAAGERVPLRSETPSWLVFDLPRSFARLRVEIEYWSLTGPHVFGALSLCNAETGAWRMASVSEVLPMLVSECFAKTGMIDSYKFPELMRRVLNSYDQIRQYCRDESESDAAKPDFLKAEQALRFGHWLHPTPKSREGMTDWHQKIYAPERGGRFRLTFFAADRSITVSGSADGRDVGELLAELPDLDIAAFKLKPGEMLIPMHPLQAEALRLRPEVQRLSQAGLLRDLGTAGAAFTATSSVRTVYADNCPWMLKFSLPVTITNSLRVNLLHELEAGVLMTRLLRKTGFLDGEDRFSIIHDPAYLTLTLPGQSESGFEVILRENPFVGTAKAAIVNIAALTADPLPGSNSLLRNVVGDLARKRGTSKTDAAQTWFGAYLNCALRPAIALYDRFGIALEAHQQNSLLDISDGMPTRYYFRDNQGYYISDRYVDQLTALEPGIKSTKALCFPESEIHQRFCYYLIINQIFSVISRLGQDGLADEASLLSQLRKTLQDDVQRRSGTARRFIKFLLETPDLTAKANLLTRIHDLDELEAENEKAVYVRLTNPLISSAPIVQDETHNVRA